MRLLRALREGWLMLGIVLIMFLGLEMAFRAGTRVLSARASRPEKAAVVVDSSHHPYAHESWFPAYRKALDQRHNHFDPYRSNWADPLSTPYIHVDSAGMRVTPQPVPDTVGAWRVVMLGGSLVWGFDARDSSTIPALVAARIAALGIPNVHVVNLGQAAYNATQEAATLMLEVANGRTPDLVVAYDGYPDILTALKYREPGHTYGDDQIAQQIMLGRRMFWGELVGLGRHSKLIDRLQQKLKIRGESRRPVATDHAVCGAAGKYLAGIAGQVEAIGRSYNFPVVYIQPPLHATTGKPLSAWERSLTQDRRVRECADSIDAAMTHPVTGRYVSLRTLFDADTVTRFIDADGHITEAANAIVADRIVDIIAPLLRARMAAGPPASVNAANRLESTPQPRVASTTDTQRQF